MTASNPAERALRAVLFAAAIRLVLRPRDAGMLAVRHKAVDDGFSTGRYAHCTHPICQGVSSTTPLRRMPTPSASTSMTSPGFR